MSDSISKAVDEFLEWIDSDHEVAARPKLIALVRKQVEEALWLLRCKCTQCKRETFAGDTCADCLKACVALLEAELEKTKKERDGEHTELVRVLESESKYEKWMNEDEPSLREALEKADEIVDFLLDGATYPMEYRKVRTRLVNYQDARAKVK
jgi:hypothetical protein